MIYGIPLSWIVAGVLALGGGGYVLHCQSVTKDHSALIAQLKTASAEQEMRNEETIEHYRKEKEDADADAKEKLARLARDLQRMRNDRERSGFLSAAPACAGDPARASINRAEFDGALRGFDSEVAGIVGEGQQAVIGLDVAKGWASGVSPDIPR